MDGDVDSVVLVPGAGDGVGESVGAGVRVTILLLLQGQEVVGGDTLEDVRASGELDALDDGGDGGNLLVSVTLPRNRLSFRTMTGEQETAFRQSSFAKLGR